MRVLSAVVLFVGLGTSLSEGQQAAPSAPQAKQDAESARVKVYAVGPDVTAPELLPLSPVPDLVEKCGKKTDGKVVLSVLVDTVGHPRNIMFLKPLGTDLDKLALKIAAADHFKPGTRDGAPAVIAQSLEIGLKVCVDSKKDDVGNKTSWLQLRSQPVQKLGNISPTTEKAVLAKGDATLNRIGGKVSPPVLLKLVDAELSDEAKHADRGGICIITVLIDEHGMPQDFRVVRDPGYGLAEKALEAVRQYRFKPAMKEDEPVKVRMNVEVEFHIY